jgi:hypothetical protein
MGILVIIKIVLHPFIAPWMIMTIFKNNIKCPTLLQGHNNGIKVIILGEITWYC